ncbi:hypothetical protein NI17_009595 [Thermobifida halotolerans]|uniref:Uncharacterized protein n=1 Tax=Thermobifida halotolerans TaxID=483545 RepID=A0AA97M5U2_9ACTN|nr:hypothetical protein [Thermobifida halotolerans]UOE21347.1 hypothetical protein NI17_009595 [Thermobifida halotolerans]
MLAAQAPQLRQVLDELRDQGRSPVILDGKVFATTRCTQPNDRGTDVWYSAHKHHHGAGVRFLADAAGHPLWASEAVPESHGSASPPHAPTPCRCRGVRPPTKAWSCRPTAATTKPE